MSEIKVNKISPRTNCGTTTLGDSGDSFVIPSGVTITNNGTQTGFGRTGTVDWQTGSIKTATFTAANGEGYFANTSGGVFTMNLPSGTAGNIVSVVDYTNTFQTNALTIAANGSQKIGGVAANFSASTEGQSLTFVYVDDIEGWKNVQDSTSNAIGNPNLTATGGTITTSGDYKIHTFTGPGTFTVTNASSTAANNIVSYLVVAGGASGGSSEGGGGGAGGFREYKGPADSYTASPLDGNPGGTAVTVTAQSYPITVGAGGGTVGPCPAANGNNGSNSVFSTVTSAGGGGGGSNKPGCTPGSANANAGGSGGGSRRDANTPNAAAGNTPPVSPPQGNNGGSTPGSSWHGSGGGGGATAVGGNGTGNGSPSGENAGNGGAGATTSITASPVTYGGGGGGSINGSSGNIGTGGPGGGGNGSQPPACATAATVNTGGGGGGGTGKASGAGGSGIVVIRYKFQ